MLQLCPEFSSVGYKQSQAAPNCELFELTVYVVLLPPPGFFFRRFSTQTDDSFILTSFFWYVKHIKSHNVPLCVFKIEQECRKLPLSHPFLLMTI